MITRVQHVNVNLLGDGTSTSVTLSLQDEMKLGIVIKAVHSVLVRGPVPWPTVTGVVKDGKVVLTLSKPLNKYINGNGYTFIITLEVE